MSDPLFENSCNCDIYKFFQKALMNGRLKPFKISLVVKACIDNLCDYQYFSHEPKVK